MHDEVKNYYGKVLSTSDDLQTDACCTDDQLPDYLKPLIANVHDEVLIKYYGCGLVAPQELKGKKILDLGSGSGRDCYVLSQLVGEDGLVVGVDMTEEQLEIGRKYLDYHQEKFGFSKSNVIFKQGYIEALDELELEDETFDIIVSNCVINLSPDKEAVLAQAWRLLKEGGEMYFSDVYADRRVPASLRDDPLLYGECLSGALYWNDFQNLSKNAGFVDPRLVTSRPLLINNDEIVKKLGNLKFYSATYRLFKISNLESHCEDYGQAVIYKGTVENQKDKFELDEHHVIEAGKVFPVCGNTWKMLQNSRFQSHFEFIGNFDTHYGIFEGCGTAIPFEENEVEAGGCC